MQSYLFEIYRSLTELSAHEVAGGLLFGLVMAVATSGAWALARKRASDPVPMLCGAILLVCALSMALGLGHSRFKLNRSTQTFTSHRFDASHMPPPPFGRRLLVDADQDGDGRLTPEEAASFVKRVDRTGKGWADAPDLDRAGRESTGPHPILDHHPNSARPASPQSGF